MDTAGVYDLLPLGTASRACAHVAHIKINCDKASETSEEPQLQAFYPSGERPKTSVMRPRSPFPAKS